MSNERDELNRKREAAKKNKTKSNLAKIGGILLTIAGIILFGGKK